VAGDHTTIAEILIQKSEKDQTTVFVWNEKIK
jgi:hypothetical protein